jgi:hypothetical protein
MTLDPNIRREAWGVLKMYSTPQQELIKKNLYGPREARLAGAIVANSMVAVVHQQPTETDALRELQESAWETVSALVELLKQAAQIIEDNVAGDHVALLNEIDREVSSAEENFDYAEADAATEEGTSSFKVIVFPPLIDAPDQAITAFVEKIRVRAIPVWVADENDQTKRLKAMTIREIYNIGRVAAVVITNVDGMVLDGWYNGLPWVEEVTSKLAALQERFR